MLTQEIVSFITVLVVAVCVACLISVLYASGLRFVGARRWGRGARASLDDLFARQSARRLCGHRAVRTVAYDSDVPLTGRETEAPMASILVGVDVASAVVAHWIGRLRVPSARAHV